MPRTSFPAVMPIEKKQMPTSKHFSPEQIAAAKSAAPKRTANKNAIDWRQATVTHGGGVAATLEGLRQFRGPNKRPVKEQVAIRLDQELVNALRASGPGWQTRVNAVLKDWMAKQSGEPSARIP
jgi:uncharacterized protein (DUF4415 family)